MTADPADPTSTRERIARVIERSGGRVAETVLDFERLTGGVSSDVFRVATTDRMLCVKFAVERLRVTQEWRAPLRRSRAEFDWLSFVGQRLPGYAPAVVGYDSATYGTVMAFLSDDVHPNWKAELLGGRVDLGFAAAVGARLAEIHAASTREHGMGERFANSADFEALRLDPYLRFAASRHPAVADRMNALADAFGAARVALVHGDVSPKNILCGPQGPVFIDAECATFGDPAFDIAFVLNHLAIKAIVLPDKRAALGVAAAGLWRSYRRGIDWEAPEVLERRAAHLIPALMLARVDGKSRLEYLTPATAEEVRARALALLAGAPADLETVLRCAAFGGGR